MDMGDAVTKCLLNGDYCTLELVNLFCHGRAVSNVFNETESAPRGVNKRSEVGFLSLLEHHKPGASTSAKQPKHQVGSYYKTPRYPVWIVLGANTHYAVVFSLRQEILSDWRAECRFDLYYYDGLAQQDEPVRLTISMDNHNHGTRLRSANAPPPPALELIIRTK